LNSRRGPGLIIALAFLNGHKKVDNIDDLA